MDDLYNVSDCGIGYFVQVALLCGTFAACIACGSMVLFFLCRLFFAPLGEK
jgi:hypothetical protein